MSVSHQDKVIVRLPGKIYSATFNLKKKTDSQAQFIGESTKF
jgi:hypothetical protein